MPIYEYRCATCDRTFEVLAKFSDPEPTECEHCGAVEVTKVLHPAAVHYKGSGFYATDYAGKGRSGEQGSLTDGSDGAVAKESAGSGDGAAGASPSTAPTDGGISKTSTGSSEGPGAASKPVPGD